ncbi:MAG: HIRAN domain-containing protein [Candidatus Dojkabacteria bacterium]|nr:HIRAN domain-containing protein [Candidatus Dojkabacteria bacterium]
MLGKFISVVGLKHYFGSEIFSIGQRLKLTKDYDNKYDDEAIMAEVESVGKVGYVANSPHTVARGTRSAGRIYDTFEDFVYCEVAFILRDIVIAKILDKPTDVSNG